MKTIEEASMEAISDRTISVEELFDAGVEFAQQWIDVEDELPEIRQVPYQVIGRLKASGIFETYWVEYDIDNIKSECSHWRPIEYK